jgi:serine/threonine protein kinase
MARLKSFNLQPGRILARKYEVLEILGSGWEGEVYLIREIATDIERTAKIFFPDRNVKDKNVLFYAKKLHKLHHCPVTIQYSTQETITFKGSAVIMLISEYVEGELLSKFIERQPGKRLQPFQALHLLHALAKGMECIHMQGDYHGDLHTDNIILQRYGLNFDLKLVDMINFGTQKKEYIHRDTVHLIHIFYEALGGAKHYAKQPPEIKAICCGLKRSLILKKFKNATQLRQYIETMQWD